jgi:hypothetical protein
MHSLIKHILDSPFSPLLIWVPFGLFTGVRLWLRKAETPRRRAVVLRETQPWWLISCWILGGLAFDWCSAFRWFAGGPVAYSAPVLYRGSLIAIACSAAALLVVLVRPKATWRDTGAYFVFASFVVWILSA